MEKNKCMINQFIEQMNENNLHGQVTLLMQNGFDDWEIIKDLNQQILEEIGIIDQQEQEIILQILEYLYEYEQILLQKLEKMELKLPNQTNSSLNHRMSNELAQQEELNITPVVLTQQMILKGTSLKKDKRWSNEKFILSIINLNLNHINITKLDNLEPFKEVQSLYLMNNKILKIENLAKLTNLKVLNLESNLIRRIEGLETLVNLKQLVLSKNQISEITNLLYQNRLQELSISKQNIQNPMRFDPDSLAVISQSLVLLECEDNFIENLEYFEYLQNLRLLRLRDNLISQIEQLEKPLACMSFLSELDLRGNPVIKINKYRDQIVMMASYNLELLDDKKILAVEREYLLKLYNIKNVRGNRQINSSNKPKSTTKQDLNIQGNQAKENITQDMGVNVNRNLNAANNFSSNTVHTVTKNSTKVQQKIFKN